MKERTNEEKYLINNIRLDITGYRTKAMPVDQAFQRSNTQVVLLSIFGSNSEKKGQAR